MTHLEDPPLPQKNRDIDINIWTQLSLSVIRHPQKIDPFEVLGLACFRIQQWSINLWTQRINTFYCVSFFVFQILDLKTFVSKAVIWHSSFIRISTQGTFHQRKIRAFSLITLALLDHVNEGVIPSHSSIHSHQVCWLCFKWSRNYITCHVGVVVFYSDIYCHHI